MIVEVSTSSTTIATAAQVDTPSIIIKIGGNGLRDEKQLSQFAQGIRRVMAYLGMQPSAPMQEENKMVKQVKLWPVSTSLDGI